MLYAMVACVARSPVRLVKHPYAMIPCGILIAEDRRAVATSVVNKNQFKVGDGLRKHMFDTSTQALPGIKYGNND